jgi:hypothetical protein
MKRRKFITLLGARRLRSWLAVTALIVIAVSLAGIFVATIWDAERQEARVHVHFEISCSAQGQHQFDQGMFFLHSLRFVDSERLYTAIAAAEPDCAMAYWGIAMSRLKRSVPHVPSMDDTAAARTALQRGQRARTATPRERAYLAAVNLLFGADGPAVWQDRTVAYEHAMGALAAREPQDHEANVFYALALNLASLPEDKTYARQTKAAEILLVQLGETPNHPGIPHYLTTCLSLPSHIALDPAVVDPPRTAATIKTVLAIIATIAVGAFFVAVLPVWSGQRVARAVPLGKEG